jgi:undecaprenyl-diphosphatase
MNALARFDVSMTRTIQDLPDWFRPLMNTATLLGEPVSVGLVALFAGSIAWRQGQHRVSYAFIATVAASGFNGSLKYFIHRTRPDTLYVTHMRFKTYSFPSGHSFGSLLIYGLLACLAFEHLDSPWNWLVLGAAAIVILLIGMSRVYLGAHFPTDVIGGWLLASVFLVLIIKFFLG